MKRLVDNLPILQEGMSYDSKFVTLLASCLQGDPSCDARQVFLFEDLFEDVNDGLLCSLSLRHDRSSLGDTIFPHDSLISKMKHLADKLPVGHQYVLPQRFVTSSLIQSLKKVASMRPGVEVEINSSTDEVARELRPLMQNVRVMTLPHLSFEHCSVYRGTLGKVSPVLQKDPASVALMREPGDFERVFLILVNQLRTFYEKLNLTKWSFIVFSGETTGKLLRHIPDDQGPAGSEIFRSSILLFQGEILVTRILMSLGPPAGAVPQYSDPDVPLSHSGTNAPPTPYPPDDPPLPPPADSPRTQSPPKKIIPLDPHEQRPARMPRAPVKKSRAAKAKARGSVINLPGQQQQAKVDKLPSLPEDGDDEAPHPDAASSNSRSGLPVTEGEFPIAQSPEPDTPGEQAAPDSDSDATIDYEGQGLSSADVFFAVPKGQSFPDIPLLGDEFFEDFMTLLAGKVKAGVITQEMQRKYAKQIRRAKLEEFKSYLDNGAIRFLDKRTLKFGPRGTNYRTGPLDSYRQG